MCIRDSLSGALSEIGLRIASPIDIDNGKHFDVNDKRVQQVILMWIRTSKLWHVHLATPCSRWSKARTTGAATENGLAAAAFTVRVILACRRAGVTFSLENPAGSALWSWAPLRRALRRVRAGTVLLDQCQYGTPYKKPTRFDTNAASLGVLAASCTCSRHKEILQGLVKDPSTSKWRWKTALAARYPPRLCRSYAVAIGSMAPSGAWRSRDEPQVLARWGRALAAAVGAPATARPVAPSLPARVVLPWRRGERAANS